MANKTVRQLPQLAIPTTGSITYAIEGSQSYQATIDRIAQIMISEYGLFADPINATLMTPGTAEVILNGLNNAATARLDSARINLDYDSIVGYFDVDGGTFQDTYSNSSTFDGGGFY